MNEKYLVDKQVKKLGFQPHNGWARCMRKGVDLMLFIHGGVMTERPRMLNKFLGHDYRELSHQVIEFIISRIIRREQLITMQNRQIRLDLMP